MPHRRLQLDRVDFARDDLGPIVARMDYLAAAEEGWINILPDEEEENNRPPRLGFLALFGGGSSGLTMVTWIPGGLEHHGNAQPSVGIMHTVTRRVTADLQAGPTRLPDTWRVEQDHPRRGLIVRIPIEEPHEKVLTWALQAVVLLRRSTAPLRWHANVHMPAG